MTMRILAGLSAALLCVSSTLAQAPETLPKAPTPIMSELGIVAGNLSAGRFSVTGDYLVSFVRGVHLPPLVTTATPGTARPLAGVFGQARTSTLFGGWENDDARSGFRLGAGWWFGPEERLGIDAGFTML